MTKSDIAAIRDALAAGPTSGEWVTGNTDPLFFGRKRGNGTEPLGFVYGPSGAHYSAYGRECLATAAYIAACNPERIARLLDALEAWHTALSAVMPPDFKDWHENDKAEWPAVAAGVIRDLRRDRDAAWDALESAQRELKRLDDLSHCGCGDQFTAEEPGRCAICVMVKDDNWEAP